MRYERTNANICKWTRRYKGNLVYNIVGCAMTVLNESAFIRSQIAVKVVDIFGNDSMKIVEVSV